MGNAYDAHISDPCPGLNSMNSVLGVQYICLSNTEIYTYISEMYLTLTPHISPHSLPPPLPHFLPSGALEHISGKSRFTRWHLNSPCTNRLLTPLPASPYHQHDIPCNCPPAYCKLLMSYRVWWQSGRGIDKPRMKEDERVHNL